MFNFKLLVIAALVSCALGSRARKSHRGFKESFSVTISSAPYMAGVYWKNYLMCAGAIVHEHYIVLSASCIIKWAPYVSGEGFTVTVGTDGCDSAGDKHEIEKIIINSQYDGNSYNNDIAMIKVTKDFNLSPFVAKADLPTVENYLYEEGTQFNVTAWDDTDLFSPSGCELELKQADTVFLEECECVDLYDELMEITESMICAPQKYEDFKNMIGGVLTFNKEIVGVSSFDTRSILPQVYTRISTHIRWIIDVIAQDQ